MLVFRGGEIVTQCGTGGVCVPPIRERGAIRERGTFGGQSEKGGHSVGNQRKGDIRWAISERWTFGHGRSLANRKLKAVKLIHHP